MLATVTVQSNIYFCTVAVSASIISCILYYQFVVVLDKKKFEYF